MMPDDIGDATLDELARLRTLTPDATRADGTRRRCRALLERRQRRRTHAVSRFDLVRRRLAPVAAGVFGVLIVVYLTAVVATTVHLQGLLATR